MDDFYSLFPLGRKTLSRDRELRAGRAHHVFNRRQDRNVVFLDVEDRAEFIDIAKRLLRPDLYRDQRGRALRSFADRITLLAFCVLDNHFHLVLLAHDEKAIEQFMHRLMTSFAMRRNRRHGASGPLFDQPYQAVPVLSQRQLRQLIAYVNANHGRSEDYPFSSHSLYLERSGGAAHPWCDVERGIGAFGGLETYMTWFERAVARREARRLARERLRRPW